MANIKEKKGINLTSGFKLLSNQPIDARFIVDNENELQSIIDEGAAYEGLEVWVKSLNKKKQFNGTEFVNINYENNEENNTPSLTENDVKQIVQKEGYIKSSEVNENYAKKDTVTELQNKYTKIPNFNTPFNVANKILVTSGDNGVLASSYGIEISNLTGNQFVVPTSQSVKNYIDNQFSNIATKESLQTLENKAVTSDSVFATGGKLVTTVSGEKKLQSTNYYIETSIFESKNSNSIPTSKVISGYVDFLLEGYTKKESMQALIKDVVTSDSIFSAGGKLVTTVGNEKKLQSTNYSIEKDYLSDDSSTIPTCKIIREYLEQNYSSNNSGNGEAPSLSETFVKNVVDQAGYIKETEADEKYTNANEFKTVAEKVVTLENKSVSIHSNDKNFSNSNKIVTSVKGRLIKESPYEIDSADLGSSNYTIPTSQAVRNFVQNSLNNNTDYATKTDLQNLENQVVKSNNSFTSENKIVLTDSDKKIKSSSYGVETLNLTGQENNIPTSKVVKDYVDNQNTQNITSNSEFASENKLVTTSQGRKVQSSSYSIEESTELSGNLYNIPTSKLVKSYIDKAHDNLAAKQDIEKVVTTDEKFTNANKLLVTSANNRKVSQSNYSIENTTLSGNSNTIPTSAVIKAFINSSVSSGGTSSSSKLVYEEYAKAYDKIQDGSYVILDENGNTKDLTPGTYLVTGQYTTLNGDKMLTNFNLVWDGIAEGCFSSPALVLNVDSDDNAQIEILTIFAFNFGMIIPKLIISAVGIDDSNIATEYETLTLYKTGEFK